MLHVVSVCDCRTLTVCEYKNPCCSVICLFAKMLFHTAYCSAYPNASTDEVLACERWFEGLGRVNRLRITASVLRIDTREIWFEWKVFGCWQAIGCPRDSCFAVRRELQPEFEVSMCSLLISDYRQSTLRRLSELSELSDTY